MIDDKIYVGQTRKIVYRNRVEGIPAPTNTTVMKMQIDGGTLVALTPVDNPQVGDYVHTYTFADAGKYKVAVKTTNPDYYVELEFIVHPALF